MSILLTCWMQYSARRDVVRVPRPLRVGVAVAVLILGKSHALVAQADTSRVAPLRLADVYAEMVKRSPRVEAARQRARAAEARVPGSRRLPDPQVQLGFMNYGVPSLRPMETLGMNQVQITQMLPLNGKLAAAGRAADAQAAAERSRAADTRWEQRASAAAAFYDLYQLDRSIEVARETRRLMQDLASIAESMYRVGEGRQADVLRAQVEVARMDEEIIRMRAMREAASARLAALLDRPVEPALPPVQLPSYPAALPRVDSLQRAAAASRPMIQSGEQEVRAAEASELLARKEIWPDFEIGVQYGQRRAVASADPTAMSSGTDRMASLMVGASVPIFARSRQLKMREEAVAMRRMASADLAAMRSDTRGRVAEAFADLSRARALQLLYRTTILPQAEASVTSSLSAYRVGSVPFMTVLDSRTTVNRFRQELAVLEADEGRAWAELEMLVGRSLVDSTSEPPDSRDLPPAPTSPDVPTHSSISRDASRRGLR